MLPGNAAIHNYIELELSPNGVLFAANVTNPNLTCSVIIFFDTVIILEY